jgi:RimJ/RimL family protein N-acetyltransferase
MVWENLTARLEGAIVVLEPLGTEHRDGLLAVARHPEIWAWLAHIGTSEEHFDAWFQASLTTTRAGSEGVFAIVDCSSGEPLGSTRYLSLRPEHRGLEIGWSWLTPSAWRTGANIEAKLLLCDHAFERLGCLRVEFKTDARNERSRAALAALPAQFEGILRSHMTVPDVGLRDSAYYSIIDSEWPAVRANLRRRLAAHTESQG